MKKFVVSMVAIASLAVSTARADMINLIWSGVAGFVTADGTTPLLNGGGNTIAYMVFSPSGSHWNELLAPGSLTLGDEVILGGIKTVPYSPADPYGPVPAFTLTAPYQAGFLYARVFEEGTTSNPGNLLAGTWYYQSPLMVTIDNSVPETADVATINTGSANIPGFQTDILSRQVTVVPEPTSLALIGIGALGLALRRRRA